MFFIEGCLIVLPLFLLQDNFKHHQALTNAPSIAAKVPLESFYLPCFIGPIEIGNTLKMEGFWMALGPSGAEKWGCWFEGAS